MKVKINNPVYGLPITYLYCYNPNQFEILGCSYSYGDPGKYHIKESFNVSIAGKNIYKRIFIKLK